MSTKGTSVRDILVLIAGLAMAAVAVFLVVNSGGDDEEDVPASESVEEATADPDEAATQQDDQQDDQVAAPPQDDTEVSAEPETEPETEPEVGQQPEVELNPDHELVDVPDERNDPRWVAAAYVTDSRSLDYQVPPGAWLENADYLTEEFAAQLQASQDMTSGEWDEDFIESQVLMRVQDIQVKLEETDETAGALVYVQWSGYMISQSGPDDRTDSQAVWVIVENVDGQWRVAGEGHHH